MDEVRKCKGCGQEKLLNKDNYHLNYSVLKQYGKLSFRLYCIICKNEKARKYSYKNGKRKPREIIETEYHKKCSQCKIWITKDKFPLINKNNLNKLRSTCKKCTYKSNKEIRDKNPEKQKIYNKLDWIKNKEKRYAKNKKNTKKLLAKNPAFKLRTNVSKSISRALKRNNGSKLGESILKYLPYTMDEFKKYIESKFEDWMNWDNYGRSGKKRTWQIDHIIPQSSLPYDNMNHHNFIKCWSLDNLRPLETTKNQQKSNKTTI